MYKTILVPIDTSHIERAASMFSAAKTLCSADGDIVCLNVFHEIPAAVTVEIPTELLPNLMGNAREELQSAINAADVKARIEIRSGHPARTALEFAEELDADLIIVGSHKPGLEDYFLGSTSARIVRHAKCSVLVQR